MLELTSTDSYTITGRGLIKCVQLPLGELVSINDQVRIDGTQYRVHGIESTRTMMYPPTVSRNFGLLVTEVPND